MRKLLALLCALSLSAPVQADYVNGGGGSGGTPGGTSGQVQYNNSGAFGGFTVGGDGTLVPSTGVITITKTNGTVFAPSATTDTTNASNISSGTLGIGIGGTGITTTPTNGQLLIGDTLTNNYVLGTLTAGSGCSISNAGGSITISATGTGGSVTSFSSGNLSPLFTTSVATSTSTPALSFSLTNAGAGTLFGNFAGSTGAPSYNAPGTADQLLGVAHTGGGLEYKTIAAGTNTTVTPTAGTITIAATDQWTIGDVSSFTAPSATATNGLAAGSSSTATATGTTALGNSATAINTESTAVGYNAAAGVASGTIGNSTAVGQGANAGTGTPTNKGNDTAIGFGALAGSSAGNGGSETAIGASAVANSSQGNDTVIGAGASSTQNQCTVIGANASSTHGFSTIMGLSGTCTGASGYSTAIGSNVTAGNYGTALGAFTAAGGQGGVAIGGGPSSAAKATQTGGIGIGGYDGTSSGAASTGTESIAIGTGSTASGTGSVAIGYLATDGGTANVFSVGKSGGTRTLTNVTAGVNATDGATIANFASPPAIGNTTPAAGTFTTLTLTTTQNPLLLFGGPNAPGAAAAAPALNAYDTTGMLGGASNIRPLPTTGSISGEYWHSGNWTQTGPITSNRARIHLTGTMTINNTWTVATECGGGTATAGGAATIQSGSNGAGLGGGQCNSGLNALGIFGGGGGGHGGYGGNGGCSTTIQPSNQGASYPLESLLTGSGGGGGSSQANAAGGNAGAGGGSLLIECTGNISATSACAMTATGGVGSVGATSTGSGGGGSAGGIQIRTFGTFTLAASGTITATGGAGGAAATTGAAGGGGSGGIIDISSTTTTNSGTITAGGGAAGTGGTTAAQAGSAGTVTLNSFLQSVRGAN